MFSILVIDDEEDVRNSIRDILESDGYQTVTDDGTGKILQFFVDHDIDLVILDLMLPLIQGEDILSMLKEAYPKIPVIAVTAKAGDAIADELFKLGVNDYIVKPFKKNDLLNRVGGCLKNQEKVETDVIYELSSAAKNSLSQPLCVIKGLSDLQMLNLNKIDGVADLAGHLTDKGLAELKDDLNRISSLADQISDKIDMMFQIRKVPARKLSKRIKIPAIEDLAGRHNKKT